MKKANNHPEKKMTNYRIWILSFLLTFVLNVDIFGQPFITTWKTDNTGTSDSLSITIPTAGGGYNYDVDWNNDGVYDSLGVTGSITHTYPVAGIYTIRIQGNFPRIYFNGGGDRLKILSVDQWGNIAWSNMTFAFRGANNLELNATDTPDLSNVTSMFGMFINNWKLNSDISNWDVSNVTNMQAMLRGTSSFSQNLGNWDISNVTNMANFFNDSGMSIIQYDRTLAGWESQGVSNITLGALGLGYCDGESARTSLINNYGWTINDDVLDCTVHEHFVTTWKTDNLSTWSTDNKSIHIPTTSNQTYNYDIDWDNDGEFDTLGVTGSITHTFPVAGTYTIRIRGAFPRIYFNNLGDRLKILAIEQWGNIVWSSMKNAFYGTGNLVINATDAPDLSNVTNMSGMFRQYPLGLESNSFNGNVSNWDVQNVTNMGHLFYNTIVFDGDVSNWNVEHVTNMEYMLHEARLFDSDISNWNVGNVTHMDFMFYNADAFNADISNWDVSNVTDMPGMFYKTKIFNADISNWDVGNVTNMSSIFYNARDFNQNLGNWDISNVTFMTNILRNPGLSVENYDSTLMGWNNLGLSNKYMGSAFGLEYCNGASARESLVNDYGWTINDDEFNCSALPVELLQFKATLQHNSVLLDWATASEINNAGFEIQRSKDGASWEILNFVPAIEIISDYNEYRFIDNQPHPGINYYRLKQIDHDERPDSYRNEFSEVVSVDIITKGFQLEIYPNPSRGDIHLALNNPSSALVAVTLTNMLGEQIWYREFASNTQNFHERFTIEDSGIYVLSFRTNNQTISKKVMIDGR